MFRKRLANPGGRSAVGGGPASGREAGNLAQRATIQPGQHIGEILFHLHTQPAALFRAKRVAGSPAVQLTKSVGLD